jgi:hypothetical protein
MIFKYGCAAIGAAIATDAVGLHGLANAVGTLGCVLIVASMVLLVGKFMP